MSGGWIGSDRRRRLPPDWPDRVATVKDRALGHCQAQRHEPNCNGIGTECDHIKSGDDHSLSNLQWLSTPCHTAKTQADLAAQRLKLQHPSRRAQHPGFTS